MRFLGAVLVAWPVGCLAGFVVASFLPREWQFVVATIVSAVTALVLAREWRR